MSALNTVTGSTGNPIQDSAARGAILGVLTALAGFVNDKSDWLTDQDVVTLTPIIVFAALILGGVFDKYVRPRL